MNAEDQLKLDIITLLDQKKISQLDASNALDVSERTIERYLQAYRAKGPIFAVHGNTGRTPVNKTPDHVLAAAKDLMKKDYFDFNMTHALEKLEQNENVRLNRETFRKVCHSIGLVKRAHRRPSTVRRARDRMVQEGIMVQMDGSPHRWFANSESCLIGTIDDATGEVLEAEFFESETTLACMKVLRKLIERKGLFQILYTDKAGIFGGTKRVDFSQVKRALRELGINIIFANSPQAKGRIERLWNTLQDRMVPEMRVRKIKSFVAANDYLKNQHIPNDHNKKFKVLPIQLEPAWRSLPDHIDLDQIFCIKDLRMVKRDHTFSWNNVIYKITSEFKYSIQNQKIEIRMYPDMTWKVYFADRELCVVRHHIQPKFTLIESAPVAPDAKDLIKVRADSHITHQGKYYSIDPKYIGRSVAVIEKDEQILISHQGKLIETHQKIKGQYVHSSTKPNHTEPWQKALKPGSIYRIKAEAIGPYCGKLVFALLQRGQGIIDTKSIWGIIGFNKEYPRVAVEEACAIAYKTNACNYGTVATLLRLRFRKKVTNE